VHSPVTSAPDSSKHALTKSCQLADGIAVKPETTRGYFPIINKKETTTTTLKKKEDSSTRRKNDARFGLLLDIDDDDENLIFARS